MHVHRVHDNRAAHVMLQASADYLSEHECPIHTREQAVGMLVLDSTDLHANRTLPLSAAAPAFREAGVYEDVCTPTPLMDTVEASGARIVELRVAPAIEADVVHVGRAGHTLVPHA